MWLACEGGEVENRHFSWANVKAHETTMQTRAAQLEWSQALFPARHRRKVEEAGGLFIEWPQHKYAH